MLRIVLKQKGFSIIETLMAIGISSVVLLSMTDTLITTVKYSKFVDSSQQAQILKDEFKEVLTNECAIDNTIRDPLNISMECLRAGADCTSFSGSMNLRDNANNLIVDSFTSTAGFNYAGNPCNGFDEVNGNNECPFRWRFNWKPFCLEGSSCENPMIEITSTLEHKPLNNDQLTQIFNFDKYSIKTLKRSYQSYTNCQAALNDGNTVSNIYKLDPDGPGGQCPFLAYCEMNKDGGGWALISNSQVNGYSEMLETEIPTPVSFGKISDSKITALLGVSDQTRNNVKVELSDGGSISNVVSMFVPDNRVGTYNVADTSCTAYDATKITAAWTATPYWAFIAGTVTGKVGFYDSSSESLGGNYNGFVCDSCTEDTMCGRMTGDCCNGSLRGSIWVR